MNKVKSDFLSFLGTREALYIAIWGIFSMVGSYLVWDQVTDPVVILKKAALLSGLGALVLGYIYWRNGRKMVVQSRRARRPYLVATSRAASAVRSPLTGFLGTPIGLAAVTVMVIVVAVAMIGSPSLKTILSAYSGSPGSGTNLSGSVPLQADATNTPFLPGVTAEPVELTEPDLSGVKPLDIRQDVENAGYSELDSVADSINQWVAVLSATVDEMEARGEDGIDVDPLLIGVDGVGFIAAYEKINSWYNAGFVNLEGAEVTGRFDARVDQMLKEGYLDAAQSAQLKMAAQAEYDAATYLVEAVKAMMWKGETPPNWEAVRAALSLFNSSVDRYNLIVTMEGHEGSLRLSNLDIVDRLEKAAERETVRMTATPLPGGKNGETLATSTPFPAFTDTPIPSLTGMSTDTPTPTPTPEPPRVLDADKELWGAPITRTEFMQMSFVVELYIVGGQCGSGFDLSRVKLAPDPNPTGAFYIVDFSDWREFWTGPCEKVMRVAPDRWVNHPSITEGEHKIVGFSKEQSSIVVPTNPPAAPQPTNPPPAGSPPPGPPAPTTSAPEGPPEPEYEEYNISYFASVFGEAVVASETCQTGNPDYENFYVLRNGTKYRLLGVGLYAPDRVLNVPCSAIAIADETEVSPGEGLQIAFAPGYVLLGFQDAYELIPPGPPAP